MTSEDLIYLKFIAPSTLLTLKILSAVFSLLFIAAMTLLIRKTSWLRYRYTQDIKEFFTTEPYEEKKIEKIWAKIIERSEKPSESEYKLAIIEADGLLNEVLEKMGYQGETLGERLKKISPDILPNIQEIPEVHKLRNNIVHDPDYRITLEQTRETLKIYEKALQDLNAL